MACPAEVSGALIAVRNFKSGPQRDFYATERVYQVRLRHASIDTTRVDPALCPLLSVEASFERPFDLRCLDSFAAAAMFSSRAATAARRLSGITFV
jgi:hypothetical protein